MKGGIPLPSISESELARLPSAVAPENDADRDDDAHQRNETGISDSPLWSRDGWSLTWPIWHLLPHDERKKLAHEHGYKTIGAFEEYMSLHQAMDDSEISRPYANEQIYRSADQQPPSQSDILEDSKPAAVSAKDKNVNEEDDDDDDEETSSESDNDAKTGADENLSFDELLQVGGQILMLHDELIHQIFAWLPVDTYATLALVSPHWKHLTRTETVYKRLCERLYLNQSKRRQLHVSRFGGSYRTMLEERPRVRAAGGCYVLKYAQVKQIQRDMWTEVSQRSYLEISKQ